MRTTVRLEDELLAAAKEHAARTGRTLTALFEDALRTFIAMERKPGKHRHRNLPTFRGEGLQPGVDLDNSADLLDVMEGRDAAH